MEPQRIILFSALAIVTYLLILAWNEDYGQPAPQAPISETSTPAQTNGALPSAPIEAAPADTGDIPTEVPTTSAAQNASEAILQAAPISSLIDIQTDLLHVQVDLLGGDLVQIALKDYPLTQDKPNVPFRILERSTARTYIAQSGLIGKNGPDAAATGRPLYQSAQASYQLADGADELIVDLTFTTPSNVEVTKRYTFTRDEYVVKVEFLVSNNSESTWQANLFGQLKRDNSDDPSKTTSMGMASFLGAATTTDQEKYKKIDFDDVADEPYREPATGAWIAILQHYFVAAWVPSPEQTVSIQVRKNAASENIAGFIGPAFAVATGETRNTSVQFYAGPKIQDRLEALAPNLKLTVDYGWLWFIAQPLFLLLSFLHGLVGNWGWAIVLTTLVIKLIFFQLSATSYKSMANMRRVGPKLQRLKEQYGDDKQKMSQAMMELYKKEKINPLGGCLPILVQMPVFIALYWVLLESVELRHSPFIFWLTDLSIKDPYFILPIAMGVTMFIQQMLNPEPPDPMQAKVMKIMPIMFTFFFLWFPAGLVLYWLANNILSIAQQWVITRQIEKAAEGKS